MVKSPLPLNKFIQHGTSRNTFMITKIHALHVETEDMDGNPGLGNRYLMEQDYAHGVYDGFEE